MMTPFPFEHIFGKKDEGGKLEMADLNSPKCPMALTICSLNVHFSY
jgi:hypothetical protein